MNAARQSGQVIPFPDKLQASMQPLPAGDAGVRKTIRIMEQLACGTEGALHPAIRALALDIVRDTAARDDLAQATAIFEWVKRNIQFRGEYDEVLQTPLVTAQFLAGDCDDHSTLMMALLRTIGIQSQFITVALDPNDPDRQFSHVYTSAYLRSSGEWLPLDTTVANSFPGWQPARVTRIHAWGNRGLGDYQQNYAPGGQPSGADSRINQVLNHLDPLIQATQERIAYGNNPSGTAYIDLPGNQRVAFGGGVANPSMLVLSAIGGMGLLWLLQRGGRR